jgi:TolB-like protein
MFFAWAFELTPEGIKKEKHVDRAESVTHITGRKLDFIIIGVLAAALIFYATKDYMRAPETGPASEATQEIIATIAQKSIAVLPFVNMSSDPEQEYFSDGLSEEILNLLAKVPDLKVIGRTSSFAFKGKNEDLRGIGQALDVSTVLEGSVRKSGDRVRITAQLIDVSDGAHLWSETYDRTLTDIFAVQDSVASEILRALQIHVGAAPKRGRPTENTDAYALFLRAKAAMGAWDSSSAKIFLLQAIELDPQFAEAWELLAYTHWEQWGNVIDAASAQESTIAAASRALAINPDLVFARYLFGGAGDAFGGLFAELEGIERILREEPNHGPATDLLIYYLSYGGYFREALQVAERLVERDPLSPNALLQVGFLLFYDGERKAAAYAAMELADELDSKYSTATLSFFHWEDGRYETSLAYWEAAYQERGLPSDWIKDLHAGASDPATGQAHLDRRIPEIVASVPEERAFEVQTALDGSYLTYGFLDRYFQIIFERGGSDLLFSDAEALIANGQFDRSSGFTTHPRYLEMARKASFIDLWEKRGPPDFCEKSTGEWLCT